MIRVLVATDAWHPQVNGVVRTYDRIATEVGALGGELVFLTPEPFPTMPLPTYPEIRLALVSTRAVAAKFAECRPDYVHIATEGPIGIATRLWCLRQNLPFTTSYHTRFPDYLAARLPVPVDWGYAAQRWFHGPTAGMMVASGSLARELQGRGFGKIQGWSRGVDTDVFKPRTERLLGAGGPIFLYVGRIAVEKNVEAFLALDLPGRKVAIGGGPALDDLRQRYPGVTFTGPKSGEDLARHFASADVFVFPSRTDTFGIVLLEAMASGVPVAAFPVTGPADVVADGVSGVLAEDLRDAALRALTLDRADTRTHALQHSWQHCARQFLVNILEANGVRGHRLLAEGSPAGLQASASETTGART
mgnify:CR=1 FL=1